MSDCVEWTGYRNEHGYGRRCIGGRLVLAHRAAWERVNGPVPDGLHVLHRCDNPPCINVDHLYVGTHADNMRDRARRGRQPLTKLSPSDLPLIRAAVAAGESRRSVARRWGISHTRVNAIVRNTTFHLHEHPERQR